MKMGTGPLVAQLIREEGDKAISKESTVTHHFRRLLNERDGAGVWVRCYPNKIGLTDSRQGVRNTRSGTIYWHERYQVEAAHKAFNSGAVFYAVAG